MHQWSHLYSIASRAALPSSPAEDARLTPIPFQEQNPGQTHGPPPQPLQQSQQLRRAIQDAYQIEGGVGGDSPGPAHALHAEYHNKQGQEGLPPLPPAPAPASGMHHVFTTPDLMRQGGRRPPSPPASFSAGGPPALVPGSPPAPVFPSPAPPPAPGLAHSLSASMDGLSDLDSDLDPLVASLRLEPAGPGSAGSRPGVVPCGLKVRAPPPTHEQRARPASMASPQAAHRSETRPAWPHQASRSPEGLHPLAPPPPLLVPCSPPNSRKGAVLLDAASRPQTSWRFEAVLVLLGGHWPPRGLLSGHWPPTGGEAQAQHRKQVPGQGGREGGGVGYLSAATTGSQTESGSEGSGQHVSVSAARLRGAAAHKHISMRSPQPQVQVGTAAADWVQRALREAGQTGGPLEGMQGPPTASAPEGPPTASAPEGPPTASAPQGPPTASAPQGTPTASAPEGPPTAPAPQGPPTASAPATASITLPEGLPALDPDLGPGLLRLPPRAQRGKPRKARASEHSVVVHCGSVRQAARVVGMQVGV